MYSDTLLDNYTGCLVSNKDKHTNSLTKQIDMCVCMHVCTNESVCVCTCACVFVSGCACVCMNVCVCVCTCMCECARSFLRPTNASDRPIVSPSV